VRAEGFEPSLFASKYVVQTKPKRRTCDSDSGGTSRGDLSPTPNRHTQHRSIALGRIHAQFGPQFREIPLVTASELKREGRPDDLSRATDLRGRPGAGDLAARFHSVDLRRSVIFTTN
jgi:hypothetical protein